MTMKMLTKYTINRQTWLRGVEENALLLNSNGMMCCLGQVCLQSGITSDKLLDVETPYGLTGVIEDHDLIPYKLLASNDEDTYYSDSTFARTAMTINDNEEMHELERETKLTQLFKENGIELEFVN